MSIDLNKVYQLGLEKFAGDQKQAVEFVEGFAKEAGFMDVLKGNADGNRGFIPSIMEGAGKGLGGALVSGVVGALGSAATSIGNGSLHNKFMMALEHAINTNPLLKSAKREKVIQYAESIFKFAPHVSTDTNILSSILANAVHGEGIDPLTIKTLVDLESKFKDNTTFSPKSYI
jgi:hypothetical protein